MCLLKFQAVEKLRSYDGLSFDGRRRVAAIIPQVSHESFQENLFAAWRGNRQGPKQSLFHQESCQRPDSSLFFRKLVAEPLITGLQIVLADIMHHTEDLDTSGIQLREPPWRSS